MPAENGGRGKQTGKKKAAKGVPAVSEQLGENDRVLEVRFRATIKGASDVPQSALQSFLHCAFRGEDTVLRMDEVFTRQDEEPPAKAKQPRNAPPIKGVQDGDVDFLLAQRRIVVDLPTLSELLCGTGDITDSVTVYGVPRVPTPPSLTTPQAAVPHTTAAKPGKGGKGNAKGPADAAVTGAPAVPSPAPPGGRAKHQASAKGAAARVEDLTGEQLDRVALSYIDVMHVTEHEYSLALAIPGVERPHVVLRSRNGCLTPQEVLRRYRPVCFTVWAIINLPQRSCESPVKVAIDGLGHHVVSAPLFCSEGVCKAGTSQKLVSNKQRPALFRTVRFLGDMPPLQVYQSILLDPVHITVLSCGGKDARKGADHVGRGAKCGKNTEEATGAPYGSGMFSVRDLVTDKQTLFDETVPLLPTSRAAVVSNGADSCLTKDSVVKCTVDFFLVLPPLQHVSESGEPAPRGSLMTRGVAVLPYASSWMPDAIDCLLKELMASRRATEDCDVKLYTEPTPPPSVQEPISPVHSGTAIAGDGGASLLEISVSASKKTAVTESTAMAKSSGTLASSTPKPNPKLEQPGGGSRGTESGSALAAADGLAADEVPPRKLLPFEEDAVRLVSPAGISGFEVSDGEQRILCLEGPAGEVHRIFVALHDTIDAAREREKRTNGQLSPTTAPRTARDDGGIHLLMNPELFAARRLYTSYPPLVTPPTHGDPDGGVVPTKKTNQRAPTEELSPAPPLALSVGENDLPCEVDEMGGGCGGRIHRLRLRESIRALMLQQRFLLRRTLSEKCLQCIVQLDSLVRCATLREATTRALFPTASGIISLERSFGQTLELPDIFGRDSFARPHQHAQRGATDPQVAQEKRIGGVREDSALPFASAGAGADSGGGGILRLAAALDASTPNAVGRLVSFQGLVLVGRHRPLPNDVARRYPQSLWMTSDDGTEVLCAFGKGTPSGTIRYHVEGQVVQMGSLRMLYVLEHHTLAKSFTNSHNPQYEKALAHRRRQETLKGLHARRLVNTSHANTESVKPHMKGEAPSRATRASGRLSSSDDDEDDNDADSPPCDSDPNASVVAGQAAGGAMAGTGPRSGAAAASSTKASRLRAEWSCSRMEPEMDYELLWQLYDKRAPKHASA